MTCEHVALIEALAGQIEKLAAECGLARGRLEYLRQEAENERISYAELAELQSLADHIDPSDAWLLEWAGVPEFPNQGNQ